MQKYFIHSAAVPHPVKWHTSRQHCASLRRFCSEFPGMKNLNNFGLPQYFAQYFMQIEEKHQFPNLAEKLSEKTKKSGNEMFPPSKVGADSQIRTGDLILTKNESIVFLRFLSCLFLPYQMSKNPEYSEGF